MNASYKNARNSDIFEKTLFWRAFCMIQYFNQIHGNTRSDKDKLRLMQADLLNFYGNPITKLFLQKKYKPKKLSFLCVYSICLKMPPPPPPPHGQKLKVGECTLRDQSKNILSASLYNGIYNLFAFTRQLFFLQGHMYRWRWKVARL